VSVTSEGAPLSITDETVAEMETYLHQSWRSRSWNSVASYDAIWHFAHAYGDDNPLFWNPEYAAATPIGRMFAPPTFLYSCEYAPITGGVQADDDLGVDVWLPGAFGLWASDRWVWHDRVWVDEPIETVNELWDVRERKSRFSGRSVDQVTKTTFTGRDGRPLAELYRSIFRFEKSSAIELGRYAGRKRPVYTAEDRDRIARDQLAERDQRRGAEPRYWEDVSVGDHLPQLLKGPLDVTTIIAWLLGWGSSYVQPSRLRAELLERRPGAGVVHPEIGHYDTIEAPHWEPAVAQLAGFPDGYDFGGQRITNLAHVVTDWCGDEGEMRELDARLLRPNLIGDLQTMSGAVVSKHDGDGHLTVRCSLEAVNQDGETTAAGHAVVELPSRNR
jgi:acyl dehydratase